MKSTKDVSDEKMPSLLVYMIKIQPFTRPQDRQSDYDVNGNGNVNRSPMKITP